MSHPHLLGPFFLAPSPGIRAHFGVPRLSRSWSISIGDTIFPCSNVKDFWAHRSPWHAFSHKEPRSVPAGIPSVDQLQARPAHRCHSLRQSLIQWHTRRRMMTPPNRLSCPTQRPLSNLTPGQTMFPSYLIAQMMMMMMEGMGTGMDLMTSFNPTLRTIGMMIWELLIVWTHPQIPAFSPPLTLLWRTPPLLPWW